MAELHSSSTPTDRRYAVVGTRPIRHDGVEKVTGQARYGADIRLPGMLYGKVLRSPHAHARIKAIDTRRAGASLGVYAVVTSADLVQHHGRITDISEGTMNNLRFMSHNVLAADKVLYKGHALAAVAATNVHVAEEALALIAVEYEILPPVMTAAEAMQEGAPLVHERHSQNGPTGRARRSTHAWRSADERLVPTEHLWDRYEGEPWQTIRTASAAKAPCQAPLPACPSGPC
jgi:CO/xanthine dehydrogenase Mo-binding subunit